jgi:alpha-tubulin suppressor-like RCC1 family protein
MLRPSPLAHAYLSDKDWAELTRSKEHTMVYVWGEGYQVDSSQEFSNFTPKKIKTFYGVDKPDIIDMAFGHYHEAYIDKQGRLYVCAKVMMSSLKIKEVPDGYRDVTEITSIPKAAGKVRQVAFTRRRMFVLTDKGKLFGFAINEKSLSREEQMFAKNKPKFTGDLQIEQPMYVKELPPLKMIATGIEHMLALDRDGKVWAMGEDTFG